MPPLLYKIRGYNMQFTKLNLQDETMLMALLPFYQAYEAEISNEVLEDIFPPNEVDENFRYFKDYFGRGYITYICTIDDEFRGFICFHKVGKNASGYADGYDGWGHMAEIYVDKQSRELGLGKIMVKKAEEELEKLGTKNIYLTDIADNNAFWISLGYINTGKIEPKEGGKIYEKHMQ